MKLFEQLRKNIQLNKKWEKADPKEKGQELRDLRKEFYNGLITDLLNHKFYELSEIVMAEKTKEKFTETINDELLGLNIYAAQDKFDEYKLRFDTLLNN